VRTALRLRSCTWCTGVELTGRRRDGVERRARSPVCVAEENASDSVARRGGSGSLRRGPPTRRRRRRRRRRLWRARDRHITAPRTGVRPPSHIRCTLYARVVGIYRTCWPAATNPAGVHGADQWARCGVHPAGSPAVPSSDPVPVRAAVRRRNRCHRIIYRTLLRP